MKYDMAVINKYVEDGLIRKQNHPTLPIAIYKYSDETVYSDLWDDISLAARGLVLDESGEVIINCIPKFFNNNQKQGMECLEKHIGEPYYVSDKKDGSLIQVANYKNELLVTSSGSFQSTQAIKATEILQEKGYDFIYAKPGKTWIFEYISPCNRIVIPYKETKLILLAVRDTETGEEEFVTEDYLVDWYYDAISQEHLTIEEIEKELPRDTWIQKEGWVVKYEKGDRVKFKYRKYLELHKLISHLNETTIWENLFKNTSMEETLANIPDELMDFYKKTKADLLQAYKDVDKQVEIAYNMVAVLPTRKEQAMKILSEYKEISNLVFAKLDDAKDYSDRVWKKIKPEHNTVNFGKGE